MREPGMAGARQEKGPTSLRVRTFVILVIVVFSYTALSYLVQRLVILPSFVAVEQESARKDVLRCVEALRREVQEIDGVVRDWANWNDTYKFIQDRHNDYIKANLTLPSYKKVRMNLIYLLDTEGRVVWGEIWSLERGVSIAMPDFPSEALPGTHALLQPEAGETSLPREGRSGVFTTTLGPMLVASRPILQSNNEGPVRGTLIMGRFVDEARSGNSESALRWRSTGGRSREAIFPGTKETFCSRFRRRRRPSSGSVTAAT
jgi:sensor domain CHASE-containing protein